MEQALERLRRLKAGIEKSQDIYGVDCKDIPKAAQEVKAKIICDQREVIDGCIKNTYICPLCYTVFCVGAVGVESYRRSVMMCPYCGREPINGG